MNKNNLEDKILKKVYKYERERTSLIIARYLLLVVGVGGLIILAVVRIYEMLGRQGTLDLLQIFGEDSEILQQYWGEITDTFITELPKFLLLELGILLLIFLVVLVFIIRNAHKIKNRLSALKRS